MSKVWASMIGFTFAFNGAAIILMRVFDPGGVIDLVIDALLLGAMLSLFLFGLGIVLMIAGVFYVSWEEARREREQDV
jgi:predicted phage tail protein